MPERPHHSGLNLVSSLPLCHSSLGRAFETSTLSRRIYWAHETAQCYIRVKALKALLPVRGGPDFCSACREYNAFVESVAEETKRWRQRQAAAMAEQLQLDEESLQRLQAASRHVKVESLIPFPIGLTFAPVTTHASVHYGCQHTVLCTVWFSGLLLNIQACNAFLVSSL